jgi:hypothetical protein
MENISFLATINQHQELEISLCAELPDSISMVKVYPEDDIELYFDGEVLWTSGLEAAAEELLHTNLAYANKPL